MSVSGASAGVCPGQSSATKADGVDRRLSRHQRLSDSRLFRETFDAGKSFAGRLVVVWLREAEDASLRLAVIASKNTFRRSVDRSRAKRLMREAFRLNRYRFHGKVDVILVARRYLGTARIQDVEAELVRLAGNAGILAEGNKKQ
jgi:ribonuclease P protein component